MEEATPPKAGEKEEEVTKNKAKELSVEQQDADLTAEKPFKIYAAVSFVVIMIFLGLPLWWKTTEVYRASLPSAHIAFLSGLPVEVPLTLRFTYFDEETNKSVHRAVKELAGILRQKHFHHKLEIPFRLYSSEASRSQKSALQNTNTFRALDERLYAHIDKKLTTEDIDVDISLEILVLPAEFARSSEGDIRCFFGQSTGVYVRNSKVVDSVARTVEEAVLDVYLNVERMEEIFGRTLKETSETHFKAIDRKIWTGTLHPHQVLDYYLINPNPEKCMSDDFDFGGALDRALNPLYAKLAPVTQITAKSQRLFHVGLPSAPTLNKKEGFYYFRADQLPHLINPLEGFVTTLEAEKPVLNLMVLIAPPEYSPLYILDRDGRKSAHNGFVVASWGALVVYNPEKGCNDSLREVKKDLMEGLVAQLRILLGMSPDALPEGFQRSPSPLSTWELHRLMMHALAENMLTAGTTLQSLMDLLSGIRNIVISDEIGERIRSSVEGLQLAVRALDSRNLPEGLEHSKRALLEAEVAFSDPSLLALLYFPDDQKYAIYIPLFLPVGLPVVLSVRQILKFYRESKKAKTE